MSAVFVSDAEPAAAVPGGLPQLHPRQPIACDDFVVSISAAWRTEPRAAVLIDRGVALARTADATAVMFLDGRGEELTGLRIVRGSVERRPPASQWVPFIVDEGDYHPRAHRAEAEQYRDRIGDRLLRPEAVDPDKRHLIADDHQRASRVLDLGYHGRVLDVGTSDGTLFLQAVRKWNLSGAVGIDVAPSAIDEAKAAVAHDPDLSGRVTFEVGFIEDLAYADGTFDTVSACETLEHVGPGQFDAAFGNLMRMLKPGGALLTTVPNRYPDGQYEREGRARWSWPAHHQFFTECSLRHLLASWFATLEFLPLYDGEPPGDSIYLICRALGRR